MSMYRLTIIVGLPCSGKTTLATKMCSDTQIELFDDFITTFCDGALMSSLINDKNVCITDPRLCNVNIFKQYFSIFTKYVDINDILLILIDINVNKCIEYNDKRSQIEINKNVKYDIKQYAQKYDVLNYKDLVKNIQIVIKN